MIDAVFGGDEGSCDTGLTVLPGNLFCEDGHLTEPGLIEHAAQSAAALAGLGRFLGGEAPEIGVLAEVKKFTFNRLPAVGEALRTHLSVLGSASGTTLVQAAIRSGSDEVAGGLLKIHIGHDI